MTEEIKTYIAKNSAKLVPKFMKCFNSMCGRCRQMCISNPSRPMTDYCERDQIKFKEILEGEVK